jgi:hypothetical protein
VSFASTLLGTAAAVTLLVASAARPVSANDCAIHGTCCFGPNPAAKRWKPSSVEPVFGRFIVSDGGLQPWEIRRSLDRQAAPIAACFDLDGAIDATVSVTFVIGASGRVSHADAASKHSRLATCVAATWIRTTFPATRDFALTQVTVTVHARR